MMLLNIELYNSGLRSILIERVFSFGYRIDKFNPRYQFRNMVQ